MSELYNEHLAVKENLLLQQTPVNNSVQRLFFNCRKHAWGAGAGGHWGCILQFCVLALHQNRIEKNYPKQYAKPGADPGKTTYN